MSKYHYYVSYQFTKPSAGIGCLSVELTLPIRSMKDIDFVINIIKQKTPVDGVVINFFQKFEK